MLFFLMLAVYLIEVRHRTEWGVLSFAIAAGIKIVPALLLPTLLLYFKTWSSRLRACLIVGLFWLATALPWLIASPGALVHNVLGYGSLTGHWGLGLILRSLPLVGAVS